MTRREQRSALDTALDRRTLRRESITDIAVLADFADLRRSLDRGEAACLAFAYAAGLSVASDEKGAFRRLAIQRVGRERLLSTPDLFVMAIRAHLITVEEADSVKRLLETRRFRMTFGSFAELLSDEGTGG